MLTSPYAPVIEVLRGETIESLHWGAIAVVAPDGHLVASYGNPQATTFLRSAAKPLQVLPFLEAGGQEHYHLTFQEIAILCASHSGTAQHVAVLENIQARAQLSEANLLCGVHYPLHEATAEALKCQHTPPTPNRHNCSGKHTGMLAYARMRNLPLDDYINPQHPIQRTILSTVAEMCQIPEAQIALGTDGCSAPNFALPLYHAAWGMARLCAAVAGDVPRLSAERAAACRTVVQAMSTFPDMVGGPERFDTRLGCAASERLICKGGAEGYQSIGLLPGALGPGSQALGIAIKIADGDPKGRARAAVALETLRQLNALPAGILAELEDLGPTVPVRNWRELIVGQLRPCFQLARTTQPDHQPIERALGLKD